MGRTSKKHWDEKFKNRIWEDFLINIKKVKNEADLKKILNSILTDDEIITMEKRLAVKELLKDNISYSEISRRADLTRATIRFVRDNFRRPVWKKRIYSETKKNDKTKWRDPLKPRFRKYRFIPKRPLM